MLLFFCFFNRLEGFIFVLDKIMDLCTSHFLNRSVSEQSLGDSTPVPHCSQPEMAHPSDGIGTSFDALCLQHIDHPSKLDTEHWGKTFCVFVFVF